MSNHEGDNHGSTPAAWTAVIICIVGFAVGGVSLPMKSVPLFVVGAAFAVASPFIGKVMHVMGLGNSAK